MTNKEMQTQINDTAKSVRKTFKETMPADAKVIEINTGIPYVALEDYYFQGEEAENLLAEANTASEKFDVSVENYILFISQGW